MDALRFSNGDGILLDVEFGVEGAVADAFATSPEFEEHFGGLDALTPEEFVRALYRNILGREGEEAGVAFWTGVMEDGLLDEAAALAAFAESPENVERTESFESIALNVGTGDWSILAPL